MVFDHSKVVINHDHCQVIICFQQSLVGSSGHQYASIAQQCMLDGPVNY